MVVGFAKYLGGRLVAGAKSIGDAVVQSGVKSVSAIVDSGKAVKDFATKVVTDAADKFRGHFSDDVPGGDDASTLPAVEPLQIELRLALEPADRKFIDLLRMMSPAHGRDGDPLPPLPPEASWASSEKTLLQLSLTYDEWPGARRDDGKQLMRWRPASDRSLKVQVGSYSRAADTQKLMQHVHARAEGVRAALVSLGEARRGGSATTTRRRSRAPSATCSTPRPTRLSTCTAIRRAACPSSSRCSRARRRSRGRSRRRRRRSTCAPTTKCGGSTRTRARLCSRRCT